MDTLQTLIQSPDVWSAAPAKPAPDDSGYRTPALKNEDSRNQELSAVGKQCMGLKSVDEGATQFVDKTNLKAQVESTCGFNWNQHQPVWFGS